MLEIKNLIAGYENKSVLKDISLSVGSGEILAVIGPNGAGKTTLIRAVSGTMPLVEGKAKFNGKPIMSLTVSQRARLIAVVPQAKHMGGAFTVRQAVLMGRTAHMGWLGRESQKDMRIVETVLARSGLTAYAERQIAHLSGGEQQRVMLARALAQKTPVLLLDEPTNHLDLRFQVELLILIKHLVREDQLTVIFAMHDLNLVSAIVDKVEIMVAGRIHAIGLQKDVLTAEMVTPIYGIPVERKT